ncbi:MAG: hypothetical protein ACK4GG_13680 [Sphingomonas sp.]
MSHDQKPPRMRVVDGTAAEPRRRSEAGGPLTGGFAAGPVPRLKAARAAGAQPGLGRVTISILFLCAALIGGAVQAWLVLRA